MLQGTSMPGCLYLCLSMHAHVIGNIHMAASIGIFLVLVHVNRHCFGPPIGGFPPMFHEFPTPLR